MVVFGAAAWLAGSGAGRAAELNRPIPPPALDESAPSGGEAETAVLAGGCFWGQQAVFAHVRGVTRVVAGYAGGARETASYRQVGRGGTGHAEAVAITYDPAVISYGALLRIFFSVAHDPTGVDRQGPDRGPQYRSAIFAADAGQAQTARAYIAQLEAAHAFRRPIATRIAPLTGFFPAEDVHQDYVLHYPQAAYVKAYDLPKLAALARIYPQHYRDAPVTFAAADRPAGGARAATRHRETGSFR